MSGTSGINSDTGAGRLGLRKLVERAAQGPTDLDDSEWIALLTATGADLESMIGMADEVRRYTVGEAVSMVRNRNLTSAHLRATPSGPPEFGLFEAAAIARDAVDLGASEMCLQGALPASEDPSLYVELARTIAEATPNLHLHAYRPQDIADLCDRSGLLLNDALAALKAVGISTIPGTGVKVLSERVRAEIAPADLDIGRWTEIVKAAHRAGLRSSSVLFYGHVETASERITHLRILRALQDTTGGFTEFVPIPLPGYGVPLVDGRAPVDEHRAMVAVSRLFLAGSIRHIQIPWTRHGVDLAIHLLRAGGDDLGGTLMDGRVRPDTGVEQGLEFPFAAAAMRTGRIFRPLRERATDYREGRT